MNYNSVNRMTVIKLYAALGKLIADGKSNYGVVYKNDEHWWQLVKSIEVDEETKVIAITG